MNEPVKEKRINVNAKRAFGLPSGTVRATITIILIAITFYLGLRLMDILAADATVDVDKDVMNNIIAVFTGFSNLTSIMIGSYIARGGGQ